MIVYNKDNYVDKGWKIMERFYNEKHKTDDHNGKYSGKDSLFTETNHTGTCKLYYETPYVKTFHAAVLFCEQGPHGYEVILDRTGFYPEGGGQPGDTGFLDDAKILDVHEKQGRIIHYTDVPIEIGKQVYGGVDWDRRYANMQQHSGEHLLSGLIHNRYGYDNVGFHIGTDVVTVDFNGCMTMEQLEETEREANRIIYMNLPISQFYPTAEELHNLEYRSKKELTGQVRIVEIPGSDICACCGTHVERTGEIGIVKILGMTNYKGGVRVTMLCGMKAVLDYEKKQSQVIGISKLLSARQELIVEAVERMRQESAEKDYRINHLYQQLFQSKAKSLPQQGGILLVFEEGLMPVQLRIYCTMLCEQKRGDIVAVCSGEERRYQYALGSDSQDMRAVSKELNAALNGRGGGSARLAQGTFMASRQEIERALRERNEVVTDGFE